MRLQRKPGLNHRCRSQHKMIVVILLGLMLLLAGCSAGPSSTAAPVSVIATLEQTLPPAAIDTALPPTATDTAIPPTATDPVPPTDTAVPVATGEAIKIGLLAPISGSVPTFGASALEGVELAVKEWNAKGGVLGRPIELVVGDSQCYPDAAVAAANKLIDEDGVRYVVGEICSIASIPISEIVNQKGVVQISPTSTNPAVTLDADGVVKPYTFRACLIDPAQGPVMAKFARDQGYTTAFIMANLENDYMRGMSETFERAFFELGGQIVGKATYGAGETDFSAILDEVAASQAEVLFLPDYASIVNLVGAQAKQKDITAVMMGGDGWESPDLDPQAADGGFHFSHFDASDTRPIATDWIERYGAAYSDDAGQPKIPDIIATFSYDAANMLLAAIEKAGIDDPAQVAAALAALTWDAVTGRISFDGQHNPLKPGAVIGIKDGEKRFVEAVGP